MFPVSNYFRLQVKFPLHKTDLSPFRFIVVFYNYTGFVKIMNRDPRDPTIISAPPPYSVCSHVAFCTDCFPQWRILVRLIRRRYYITSQV